MSIKPSRLTGEDFDKIRMDISRRSGHVKRTRDPEVKKKRQKELRELRVEYNMMVAEHYVQAIVACDPPLSVDHRAWLAAILCPEDYEEQK